MSNLFHDSGPAATGQKVMLATIAYDSPNAAYTFSIQRSRQALSQAGIQSAYLLLSGNCHVDDARNVVCQEFLLSDCTELIFLDADVSWESECLVELCGYNCDIVGGVYPYRREEKKNMPLRMIEGVWEPDENGLLQVEGLPAGFMRIKRHVIERLEKDADKFWNNPDKRSKVAILFERHYHEGTRWGGDLHFCNKWRATGGKVFAVYEMCLGHTAKSIIKDSLGAAIRRQRGHTLRHVADKVREGSNDIELLSEALRHVGNPYGAIEDVLILAVLTARKADGPILEIGSGLTTILMAAAAPDQTVYCIEHDEGWAAQLETMAFAAGVSNIALCKQPIRNGWYDLSDIEAELPEQFALALVDGPPRYLASRMPFYERFGQRCETIIADDTDDPGYVGAIREWAVKNGRRVDFVDERAALIRKQEDKKIAA